MDANSAHLTLSEEGTKIRSPKGTTVIVPELLLSVKTRWPEVAYRCRPRVRVTLTLEQAVDLKNRSDGDRSGNGTRIFLAAWPLCHEQGRGVTEFNKGISICGNEHAEVTLLLKPSEALSSFLQEKRISHTRYNQVADCPGWVNPAGWVEEDFEEVYYK